MNGARREAQQLRPWRATVGIGVVVLTLLGTAMPAAAGPVQNLSPSGQNASGGQVAVNAEGSALVVWQRFDGAVFRVQARTRSPIGTLGPVETLSAAGQSAFTPLVEMDVDGNSLVVWQRSDGSHPRIQAQPVASDGTPGAVQDLSNPGVEGFYPDAGVDADGDAVIVWLEANSSASILRGRRRAADGTLGPIEDLTGIAGFLGILPPSVDVNGKGDAVVTWIQYVNGAFRVLARRWAARRWAADGTLGAEQTVSAAAYFNDLPQVGVRDDGGAVIIWQEHDGVAYRIYARALAASGNLGNVKALSPAGQNAEQERIAFVGVGDAGVVWRRSEGAN
jgi:hypothetical protein